MIGFAYAPFVPFTTLRFVPFTTLRFVPWADRSGFAYAPCGLMDRALSLAPLRGCQARKCYLRAHQTVSVTACASKALTAARRRQSV